MIVRLLLNCLLRGFFEVYLKTSIEMCEAHDTKCLYRKAKTGEDVDSKRVRSPYDVPEKPELVLNPLTNGIDELIGNILAKLLSTRR